MDDPRRVEWEKGGNCYAEVDRTGRYGRFDEVLGKGAMKTVYRAFDELTGMEVAWNQAKMCDVLRSPEALERMYSEVHLLSTLDHESIIRFQASWFDIGKRTFNFITELFTSGSLREYRQRYRRVNIRAIKRWASQILHGLVYLHGSDPPVIHRDIKCDNIFVNGHLGQVKIGDLGLAAVLRGSQNAHSVIGTPEFMAPELYEEEYNELVDIYSFGMCILEMLTSEYPYSECSNPAQIYKKVTSGKLPDAFCRIQDPNARRFIGRCLETASKRSSAKELLLDPFLLSDDHHNPVPLSMRESFKTKETGLVGYERLHSLDVHKCSRSTTRTDMTITGKMNPEDNTIFLKVQITDKDGNLRKIYFPFDIVSDTPIDVANEMVKELEIVDREPLEIAEVITKEISNLVPNWKDEEPLDNRHQQVYSYNGDDDKDEGFGHPFNYPSSSTSSHVSEFGSGSTHGEHYPHAQAHNADWLRDDLFSDDDDTSSMRSENYSAVNYQSGNEQDNPLSLPQAQAVPKNLRPTRFSPLGTNGADTAPRAKFHRLWNASPSPEPSWAPPSRGGKKLPGGFQMTRNRSMVDVRRQLLHRALAEALSKRLCKTMGAVENIGFRISCLGGSRRAPPSPRGGGRKLRVYGD